jgi:hypothetical protein
VSEFFLFHFPPPHHPPLFWGGKSWLPDHEFMIHWTFDPLLSSHEMEWFHVINFSPWDERKEG